MKIRYISPLMALAAYASFYVFAESAHEHGEGCTLDHANENTAETESAHENGEGRTLDYAHENTAEAHSPILVTADARARQLLLMKIEEVPAASMALQHSLYGYLSVPSHALETYSLPCGGRIELKVKSAQQVKKGELLYTVVSPGLAEQRAEVQKVQAGLARCTEEMTTLRVRMEKLQAAGTANSELESQLRFKEAEQRQLRSELDVAQSRLAILTMGGEIVESSGLLRLEVRAHADGVVRNVGISQGSWGEQGSPVITMSNTAAMEVEAALYANDLPQFTTVRATLLSGREHPELQGEWRLAEQVDQEKQTRALYFTPTSLPEGARPGQLCRLDLYADGGENGSISIPDSAIMKVGVDDVVFLEVKEGTFAMVKVQAGTSRRGMTPVQGLVPGQRLVVKGGYELRYLLPADGKQQKKAGHFHADGNFHEGEDH